MASFAAAGFAKGFATGFINERNRRLDTEKSKDEITLRYQLENLTSQKEDWKKKQEQEQKYLDGAKFVSKQIDNPAFASTALEYIRQGYDPSDVIQKYQNGEFEQLKPQAQTIEIPNPDVKPKVVPAGVDMTQNVSPAELQKLAPNAEQKLPNDVSKLSQVDPAKAMQTLPNPEVNDRLNRVNEQIKEIDPTLLEKRPAPETVLKDGAMFKYLGPTKKIDLGTYEEEKFKLQDAIQRGDKVAEAKQRMVVRIFQENMEEKAALEAKKAGKNIRYKIIVGKDGIMKNTLTVDDEGKNIATGNTVVLAPGETSVDVTEDDKKYIRDVQKEFEKPKQEYDMQKAVTIESLEHAKTIVDIMNKSGNEDLNSTSAGVLNLIDNGFANFESMRSMLTTQYQTSTAQSQRLDQLAREGGSPEEFSAELGKFQKMAENTEKAIADNLPKNGLVPELQQKALDKLRLENAIKMMAYTSALAKGQTAGKMSDKDLKFELDTNGASAQRKQALLSIVYKQLMVQRNRLDDAQGNLKKRAEERLNTLPPGFDIGLSPKRLGDYFEQQVREAPDEESRKNAISRRDFFNGIENGFNQNISYTRDEMNRSKIEAEQKDVPVMYSTEDAMKLPSGTQFKTPDGRIKIRP